MKKRILYSRYKVEGLNLDYLINRLKNSGIGVYDYERISTKEVRLTISFVDNKKFFAISKDLCYNITKIKESGIFRPFFLLYKNVGLLVGILVFSLGVLFCDNLLLSVDVSGNGRIYENSIKEYLSSIGVERYQLFSNIDIGKIENQLNGDDRFSFVTVKKSGNRLKIDAHLADNQKNGVDVTKTELVSTCSGTIESIKVYRGTALKNVGDRIEVGETIVSGVILLDEEEIKTYVVAEVSVIAEYELVIEGQKDLEKGVIALAKEFVDGEIVDAECQTISENETNIYCVKIKHRIKIYSG